MQVHTITKGSKITLDSLFDAFRGMMRAQPEPTVKIELAGVIYTMTNPIENVWFVYAYKEGVQVATAQFDQFDL